MQYNRYIDILPCKWQSSWIPLDYESSVTLLKDEFNSVEYINANYIDVRTNLS
jgi:protein tyrosine phosphatase